MSPTLSPLLGKVSTPNSSLMELEQRNWNKRNSWNSRSQPQNRAIGASKWQIWSSTGYKQQSGSIWAILEGLAKNPILNTLF